MPYVPLSTSLLPLFLYSLTHFQKITSTTTSCSLPPLAPTTYLFPSLDSPFPFPEGNHEYHSATFGLLPFFPLPILCLPPFLVVLGKRVLLTLRRFLRTPTDPDPDPV
ncbi:unnamed protein product, partial [Chrysoparadoxa australica]